MPLVHLYFPSVYLTFPLQLQMFSMNTLLVITNTIGGLSVILNLCLLTLISFNTPAQLGAFRKNYYGMTVVDTLFALAQFLAAPVVFLHCSPPKLSILSASSRMEVSILSSQAALEYEH